jgi:hypothetical protein
MATGKLKDTFYKDRPTFIKEIGCMHPGNVKEDKVYWAVPRLNEFTIHRLSTSFAKFLPTQAYGCSHYAYKIGKKGQKTISRLSFYCVFFEDEEVALAYFRRAYLETMEGLEKQLFEATQKLETIRESYSDVMHLFHTTSN